MSGLLNWWHTVSGSEGATTAPVDQPGSLTVNVSRSGRNYIFAVSLSDPDGISAVNAASLTARSDGQVATFTMTRRDANTFTYPSTRRNARWASGTVSATYTDGNGVQSTLSETWST